MASLLYTKYHPDEGIQELLNGENVVPPVTKGNSISTKGWKQESLLRLIVNKTEIDVCQYFGKLPPYQYEDIVDWRALREKIKAVISLSNDETLIIENNKVISIIKTSVESPRAIILNTAYKYFENFNSSYYPAYEKMSKESITYSYVNEFFEENNQIFTTITNELFNFSLDGKIVLTSGFGVKGAAQAFSIKQNGGICLVVDLNDRLIQKRLEDGFCDRIFYDTESALDYAIEMKKIGFSKIVAIVGNASDTISEIVNRGLRPSIVTDATPADESLSYFPSGYRFNDIFRIKKIDPDYYLKIANHSIMLHAKAMLDLQKRGSLVFEFGNSIKSKAYNKGLDNALGLGELDELIKKVLLNTDKYILKWFALSNDTEDIFLIDDMIATDFSKDNPDFARLMHLYNTVVFNKNIPLRKIILDKQNTNILARKINDMVRNEELSSPILLSISKFDDYSNDTQIFTQGLPDTNKIIESIEKYKNADFISLNYYGNQDKYHKLEQKNIVIDGSDSIIYFMNNL